MEKVKLKESEMQEVQKVETKRAFCAGMAEMFVAFTNGFGLNVTIHDYKEELMNFWNKESQNYQ